MNVSRRKYSQRKSVAEVLFEGYDHKYGLSHSQFFSERAIGTFQFFRNSDITHMKIVRPVNDWYLLLTREFQANVTLRNSFKIYG